MKTSDRRVEHLLDSAESRLSGSTGGRPRQVDIRRAASDVYYAMFHFIINRCTGVVIGNKSGDQRLRDGIARGFRHSDLKRACRSLGSGGQLPRSIRSAFPQTNPAGVPQLPVEILEFANLFVKLQEVRHTADYDWNATFRKSTVEELIESARSAIESFRSLDRSVDVRFFLGVLMIWSALPNT